LKSYVSAVFLFWFDFIRIVCDVMSLISQLFYFFEFALDDVL